MHSNPLMTTTRSRAQTTPFINSSPVGAREAVGAGDAVGDRLGPAQIFW